MHLSRRARTRQATGALITNLELIPKASRGRSSRPFSRSETDSIDHLGTRTNLQVILYTRRVEMTTQKPCLSVLVKSLLKGTLSLEYVMADCTPK